MPFILAFGIKVNAKLFMVTLCMTIYWTLDVLATFFTGIQQIGMIKMDFQNTLWNYIEGWLMPVAVAVPGSMRAAKARS